jgi:hypothetical protein
MYSLFGEKWGRFLGQSIVLFILLGIVAGFIAATKPALEAIFWAFTQHIVVIFIVSIVSVLVVCGIGAFLGIMLGFAMKVGFSLPLRKDIDHTFCEISILLKNILEYSPDQSEQAVNNMLQQNAEMESKWNASWSNKIAFWGIKKKDK